MHKVKVVQKLNLLPIDQRLAAMEEAGFNASCCKTGTCFSIC